MKSAPAVLILLTVLLAGTVHSLDVSGTLKPEFSMTDQPCSDSTCRYLFQAPLRLTFHNRMAGTDLNVAWVVSPSVGNPALNGRRMETFASVFRIFDAENRILPSGWDGDESFSVTQDLDRLNIGIRFPFATITAGRQAIYWGVAKSVSPTDFIAPIQYGNVDTEYRTGVDAVRAVFPAGVMSELDAGYVFGKNVRFRESGCWIRGRFYILQTDATVLAACFRENLMLGGSLNRSIGAGTGWVECAFVSTDAFSEEDDGFRQNFWSVSAGYDRSWMSASLYGYLEYHFSSPGSDDPEDYAQILSSPAFTEASIYLLARNYLCPGLSWTLSPLVNINANSLVNLTDFSAYISLSGEYSVLEDMVLRLGFSRGTGNRSCTNGVPDSEFGSWPGRCFLSSGYYF